ncbi:P-type DNA transfer ATPase VirB11 [Terricaulis silvestris]|uniref:Type IV secretion system protein n=1 Tax=Terricaulis silvestris TaxID=2686094 RepID=A0A6I6MMU7_9CAUL|nr:P-type DNA transfer ATPase VirB11 [Terricaulis silvestris]QGZ96825.1 Type IV secretion system protein VirB11 [Terricaulis silvestris]
MSAAELGEGGVYLRAFLAPLAPWLDRADVTDILVNEPGEVWFETRSAPLTRVDAPQVSAVMLQRLAQQIAAASHQGVNREHPLLAATLPSGARVQVVAPPATRRHYALAVRKHDIGDLCLDDYASSGVFSHVARLRGDEEDEMDVRLSALLDAGEVQAFLSMAVRAGKTFLISGGTASGKTTFLNALLKEVPREERVIVIEDTPEIHIAQPNSVGLVAVRGELGETRVGAEELLKAALRMRPDRLLVGEIRGEEAFSFLRAINTGHPGSMTTVHADSPRGAFDQIAFMAMQAGTNLTRTDVLEYARGVIDVVVQLSRANGNRAITGIEFVARAR